MPLGRASPVTAGLFLLAALAVVAWVRLEQTAKVGLIGQLRLAGRWDAGAVVLRLYTRDGRDQR